MIEPNIFSLKSLFTQLKERHYSVLEIADSTNLNRRTVTNLLNNKVKRVDFAKETKTSEVQGQSSRRFTFDGARRSAEYTFAKIPKMAYNHQ
jgi:orotate phosphoribosyltransferase-like protein